MKKIISLMCTLLLVGIKLAHGQSGSGTAQTFSSALQFRTELVHRVEESRESARQAIAMLKRHSNPSGLQVEENADKGFAALDIGHRLLAAGMPIAAEEFYLFVESSMEVTASMSGKVESGIRFQAWRTLADVRTRYLNKLEAAEVALSEARAINPDDPDLNRLQRSLDVRRGRANAVAVSKEGES